MKIFLISLLGMLAIACTSESTIQVGGKVMHANTNHLIIRVPFSNYIDTLAISEDGTFHTSFPYKGRHEASIEVDNKKIPFYAISNSSIEILIDTKQRSNEKDAVSYLGEHAEASRYLYQIIGIDNQKNMRELIMYSAEEFENAIQISEHAKDSLTKKIKSETGTKYDDLIKKVQIVNHAKKIQRYNYFVQYHKQVVPNDSLPYPKKMYAITKQVPDYNNNLFQENSFYRAFVVQEQLASIVEPIIATGVDTNSDEYFRKLISALANKACPQLIKDEIGNNLLMRYMSFPRSVQDELKRRSTEIVTNKEYIAKFNESLETIKSLKPGNDAPDFCYKDIDGEMIHLKDLKGKAVYVDVWATWCAPCFIEIPHLKTLEKELQNEDIAFISVSIDKKRQAWEEVVTKQDLKGYQLFTPNLWNSDIAKKYAIRGIPRFILIDKKGKIVDYNAPRPSQSGTKKLLLKLANS